LIFLKKIKPEVENAFVFQNINQVLDIYTENEEVQLDSNSKKDKDNKVFIKYIRTSPLHFLLSFKNTDNSFFEELNITNQIVNNVIGNSVI